MADPLHNTTSEAQIMQIMLALSDTVQESQKTDGLPRRSFELTFGCLSGDWFGGLFQTNKQITSLSLLDA